MFYRFFIDRPIIATVIALLLFLFGAASIPFLPIEQYPNIVPPVIEVTAVFNGANAETMSTNVASPLEQQILGVKDMIYMFSQNSSSGVSCINVFFEVGSDPDIAQMNVQKQVSQAQWQLPVEVLQSGVSVATQKPNILMIVSIQGQQDRYSDTFIGNFSENFVKSEINLLPGVSSIASIGERNYAMRIWLKPTLMAQMGIAPNDVIDALKDQNKDVGLGQLGQEPTAHSVPLTIPFKTQGRLTTAEQFENVVLRANLDGSLVLLKDVARVELGAQDYLSDGQFNGNRSVLLAIYSEYGANALQISKSIRESLARISKHFPVGIEYNIPYDSTIFIKKTIGEVIETVIIATILVILVVFLFLQQARLTLIPLATLVISIVGTFAGMALMGYSINILTLFGLILAVGTVVDDAIVVVENVDRNMRERHLSPKEATLDAMKEVVGPLISIVLVLCAVFIPVAFLGGIAGKFYLQFAVTISISVVLSGFLALTLSPAWAAVLLKPSVGTKSWAEPFNRMFLWLTEQYVAGARWVLCRPRLGMGLFAAVVVALGGIAYRTPVGLFPPEDQGYFMAVAFLPDGASLERTVQVDRKIAEIVKKHPAVQDSLSLTGYSYIDGVNRTTIGTSFITLKDWSVRKTDALRPRAVLTDLYKQFYEQIEDANVVVLNPPTIQGLGSAGGFEFWLQNKGGRGDDALREAVDSFIEEAKKSPILAPLHTLAQFDNLQLQIDLDRPKAKMLGVAINDVYEALQTMVGSFYVNNFNLFGRVYQVLVQAEANERMKLDNLGDMYIRSAHQKMVPLSSLVSVSYGKGANLVSRFNDFPAIQLLGSANEGYSSGEAIAEMERIAEKVLPPDIGFGWSGEAFQQIATGGASFSVLIASVLMVFLILVAQFESWSVPLAVILIFPFGALGAFLAINCVGLSNDIYFQISLITLLALSAKNAILIVEFAIQKHKEGMTVFDAALAAARLRFRAIMMTSLTFIFGVLPLVISMNAGAASRHAVGVGVIGGMVFATTLALFFVPLFFQIFYRGEKR